MRASAYVLAALAVAGLATAHAQSTTPGARTPARQPTTASSPATPTPSTRTSPTPAQQTVRPPDSRITNPTNPIINDSVNNQQRIPPAARGVGTPGNRPDCSKLRGLEKSECERRDTSRDDLPAGVTSTQPKK